MVVERTYIIPLRREFLKAPKYKRAKKSVTAIKNFISKHMKSDNVKIGIHLNLKLWEHGIKNPPGKVKVNVVKEDDGMVKVELFGFKYIEVKKEEKKKEKSKGEQLMEKLGGAKKGEKKEEVKEESKKAVSKQGLKKEVKKEEPKPAETPKPEVKPKEEEKPKEESKPAAPKPEPKPKEDTSETKVSERGQKSPISDIPKAEELAKKKEEPKPEVK